MNRYSLIVLAVLVFVLAEFVGFAAAGGIEGKVTDQKGAAVVGAAITLTDPVTGQSFNTVSDERGSFRFGGLTSGSG